jgi:hypothetical protein
VTPQLVRPLKLATLAATLWILYLVPWPAPAWVDMAKPATIAVAFAVLSWRLGVGSWPLTIVFSLTFFIHSAVAMYVSSFDPTANPAGATTGTRAGIVYFGAILFSPITLWAPVLFGALAYAFATRLRSNNRWRGP